MCAPATSWMTSLLETSQSLIELPTHPATTFSCNGSTATAWIGSSLVIVTVGVSGRSILKRENELAPPTTTRCGSAGEKRTRRGVSVKASCETSVIGCFSASGSGDGRRKRVTANGDA